MRERKSEKARESKRNRVKQDWSQISLFSLFILFHSFYLFLFSLSLFLFHVFLSFHLVYSILSLCVSSTFAFFVTIFFASFCSFKYAFPFCEAKSNVIYLSIQHRKQCFQSITICAHKYIQHSFIHTNTYIIFH